MSDHHLPHPSNQALAIKWNWLWQSTIYPHLDRFNEVQTIPLRAPESSQRTHYGSLRRENLPMTFQTAQHIAMQSAIPI